MGVLKLEGVASTSRYDLTGVAKNVCRSWTRQGALAADGRSFTLTDELTGLIGAVVRMLPTKSVQDLQLKSLKKKFKDKKFAAGCSREVIERGADMLGWSLDELMERTIAAMQASPAANGN